MRIGAHMSVAGGVSKAVDRAVLHGCEALQIFSRNASRWRSAPLDPGEVHAFRRRIEEADLRPVVSHGSYLINLATSEAALRERSFAAFLDELDRAEALGLRGVVLHPGTCTSGSERDALARVARAIRRAFRLRPRQQTLVLLENTAGQGRNLGYRFEHLAAILEHLDGSPRAGACLDTCHLVASGYDLASPAGYAATFEAFERVVGLDRLCLFHGNDSKKPLGSRVDRHEHIGEGHVGVEAFGRLLRDPRFADLAILIETEKSGLERAGTIAVDPLDRRNLGLLRQLRTGVTPGTRRG